MHPEPIKCIAHVRTFGQAALYLDVRRQHVECVAGSHVIRKRKRRRQPQPALPIANDGKRLRHFPRKRIDLLCSALARSLDNSCHTSGKLGVGDAYRRQVHAESLGQRRLVRQSVGTHCPQHRAANVRPMSSQGQIDPVLPGKFEHDIPV